MATNDEPTTDEASGEQPDEFRVAVTDSVADVEPPGEYLDEFPKWNGGVDVVVPKDVARAIAHRAGARATDGDTVTERTVYDLAYDHAQVTERFLVPADDWRDANVPLVEWVEQHGVPVDRTESDRRDADSAPGDSSSQTVFGATAEFRPGDDVPLVVTLDVPDQVLEVAGGWDELTEAGRLRLADR